MQCLLKRLGCDAAVDLRKKAATTTHKPVSSEYEKGTKKYGLAGVSHVRVTRMRDVSGQKCDCMYIKFYAPNIAHRRSISPPTIMDRFKIQLKTSLILEKK